MLLGWKPIPKLNYFNRKCTKILNKLTVTKHNEFAPEFGQKLKLTYVAVLARPKILSVLFTLLQVFTVSLETFAVFHHKWRHTTQSLLVCTIQIILVHTLQITKMALDNLKTMPQKCQKNGLKAYTGLISPMGVTKVPSPILGPHQGPADIPISTVTMVTLVTTNDCPSLRSIIVNQRCQMY